MLLEKTIIFTDLDGTLLDHDTYGFEEALPMLEFLQSNQIPLIIVTSKTREEVLRIQKNLGLNEPFIVENGAGVCFPTGKRFETIAIGFEYTYIRSCFVKYSESIPMVGFFDMSDEDVAKYTGLNIEHAADARKRTFTEPFILEDEQKLEKLRQMADADGLDIVRGGRFYHLITKGQDKANAIKYLVEHYEKESGQKYHTIALGDSANDLTMLGSVDTPVLIPQHNGQYIECNAKGLIKAPYPGPKGWNTVLEEYYNVK